MDAHLKARPDDWQTLPCGPQSWNNTWTIRGGIVDKPVTNKMLDLSEREIHDLDSRKGSKS